MALAMPKKPDQKLFFFWTLSGMPEGIP